MSDKLYMNETEVSNMTSVPVKSLQNDRYLKRGFPYTKKNRKVLYNRADVLGYLERYKVITTGE